MTRRHWILTGACALLCAAVGASFLGAHPGHGGPAIRWETDLDHAHRVSAARGKPMLVVFDAEWCGYCRKFDHETLEATGVVATVNESFVPVRLDFDRDRRVAEILEVESLPAAVVLGPDADLLARTTGFVEPEAFRKALDESLALQTRVHRLRQTSVAR